MTTEYGLNRDGAAVLAPDAVLGGRYELGKILGRGGMSDVREGWDRKLGRPVAIKLLQSGAGDSGGPETRLRFETEARATAALSSPNIVIVHDVGEHQGIPFIVMERLPGVSLADHIARGPLPQPFVHTVLDAVLAALAAAHDGGILHRDVKPGNILFTASGEPKLADFGIAKTAGGARTMTGQVVGTMAYLSPERLAGKPATTADDLYAVGVVGYEALTGRRAFPQEQFAALAHAILHESPPPIAALRPDVRPELAAVFQRAMARQPAHRFYQAAAMRDALNGAVRPPVPVRKHTLVMTAPPVPAPAPAPALAPGTSAYIPIESEPSRPSRKLWAAALAAVLLLAIMLMALPLSAPPPSPVGTTTPLAPPPTTTTPQASTVASTPELAPPPPMGPQGKPGKKPKGGKRD